MSETPAPQPPQRRRWRRALWPLYRQLLRLGNRPLLVGPWHSEVGFEALYWLPWLAKLRADLGIPPERLIPISRGGAAAWYHVPTGIELYDMRTPQEVRVEQRLQHARTGLVKQTTMTAFDRGVYADVAQTLGLGKGYAVLHPAWMYQCLAPYWENAKGLTWLLAHAAYAPPSAPVMTDVTLPEHFLAVRFYFRPTFPVSPTNVSIAKETIRQLAQYQTVIVLNSGLALDDHLDYIPKDVPNVVVLSERIPMTASNNLLVQSAVLAKADAFVGTYGGMAQLALTFRKPVLSVYDDWHSTALAHKHLSELIALEAKIPFTVVSTRILPQIQQAFPTINFGGGSSSKKAIDHEAVPV